MILSPISQSQVNPGAFEERGATKAQASADKEHFSYQNLMLSSNPQVTQTNPHSNTSVHACALTYGYVFSHSVPCSTPSTFIHSIYTSAAKASCVTPGLICPSACNRRSSAPRRHMTRQHMARGHCAFGGHCLGWGKRVHACERGVSATRVQQGATRCIARCKMHRASNIQPSSPHLPSRWS